MFTDLRALLDEPKNTAIEKAIAGGAIPIGYTCSFVPEAILAAGGLLPVRMRAPGSSGTETADIYLSSVICSYARTILEFAMDGRYDFLRGWVFAASCDHLRRLCDNVAHLLRPGFIHILDVPHKTGAGAVEWFARELRVLAGALGDHFKVDIGAAAVRTAIRELDEFNAALREIGELRKSGTPLITGAEYHALLLAASVSPKWMLADTVRALRGALPSRALNKTYRARLLLAGGELDDPAYIETIESQGGLVVCDRLCTGTHPGIARMEESDDPFATLARHYLEKTSCPRMMEEHEARTRDIIAHFHEYRADGVVIQSIKFCDCWGVESAPLVSALRAAGIPVLRLEREYRMGGEGQLRTRIQAFIESMKK